jgi:hypothetical protein
MIVLVTGGDPQPRGGKERTQFRWLAPTTANLAQLTVPVPPGFRQVSAQG